MTLAIRIDYASAKWKKAFPRMTAKMEKAASAAFAKAEKPDTFKRRKFETTILLADDKIIKMLNRDYRGQNQPTNVLSFPQFTLNPPSPVLTGEGRGEGTRHHRAALAEPTLSLPLSRKGGRGNLAIPLGDVVLAFETIKRESRAQKKTLESHALHLVVHGILHLLGYDHMRPKDAKSMEKLECDILRRLGYDDPYHALDTETGGVR